MQEKCLKSSPDQDKIGDSIERGSVFLSAAAERELKWQSYLYEPDAEPEPADTAGLSGVGYDEDSKDSAAACGQSAQKH